MTVSTSFAMPSEAKAAGANEPSGLTWQNDTTAYWSRVSGADSYVVSLYKIGRDDPIG